MDWKKIICALIGHPRVIYAFWGYCHCARCGELLGDTLGGAFNADGYVLKGHDCEKCRAAMETLKWHEKLFVGKLP